MKLYTAVHVNGYSEEKEILASSLSIDLLINWLVEEEKYIPDDESVDIDENMTFGRMDLRYGWIEIEETKFI